MGKSRDSANLVADSNIFTDITNDRVGIGTTIPTSKLDVLGDGKISGIVTATTVSTTNLVPTNINSSGVSTLTTLNSTNSRPTNLNVSGITTLTNATGTNLNFTGVGTITTLNTTNLLPTNINVSGVATFSGNVSIAGTLTFEDVTNVDSLGVVTARNGVQITGGGGLNITGGAGIITASNVRPTNLNVSGLSTFTSTVELDGALRDITGQVGAARSTLISTGVGVAWTTPPSKFSAVS